MRYLEWCYDLDPDDNLIEVDYAYLFRDENGRIWSDHESSRNGLFSLDVWRNLYIEARFEPHFEIIRHTGIDGDFYALIGKRKEL